MITRNPAPASPSAVYSPIPVLAPVTRAMGSETDVTSARLLQSLGFVNVGRFWRAEEIN